MRNQMGGGCMVEEVISTSQQQHVAGETYREELKNKLKSVCLNQLMTGWSGTLNPCYWEKPYTWLWTLLLHKTHCRNKPVSHPVGHVKVQHQWPSLKSPVGLNDVSSATVVSEQQCEAEVLEGLPWCPLRHCAFRCGETGLRQVTCLQVKTVEEKLNWR